MTFFVVATEIAFIPRFNAFVISIKFEFAKKFSFEFGLFISSSYTKEIVFLYKKILKIYFVRGSQ